VRTERLPYCATIRYVEFAFLRVLKHHLTNSQRAPPKQHDVQMGKLEESIDQIRTDLAEAEAELKKVPLLRALLTWQKKKELEE
jgi:hypothetical protein